MTAIKQTKSNSLNYRPDIDGLRAIAVISVVTFHAFPNWLGGGFVGVDVFFVISGYLITSIISQKLKLGAFSFPEFYANRVRRIFPALLVVLLATFTFGWFALLVDEYKQLGKHIAGGASFVSNFVLWGEVNYFDSSAETKPLLHLWSLGIEEQFYLLLPPLLWITHKCKINTIKIIVYLALISFILNVVDVHFTGTFYSPQTRFWELLAGSWLAWLSIQKSNNHKDNRNYFLTNKVRLKERSILFSSNNKLNILSIAGSLLLLFGFFAVDKSKGFPGYWALIPVLGTFLIILSGPNSFINNRILSNKVLVWVGLISYPIYLWHWPLLSFAQIIQGGEVSVSIRFILILASIILAWLTYQLIETPIRNGSFKSLKVKILVFLNIIVFIIGYGCYKLEGLEFRSSVQGYQANTNELVRALATDSACLEYIQLRTPSFEYCRLTNINSAKTIAVIGDSHAHVAYHGVSELVSTMGKNTLLLASSGCPPFLGLAIGSTQAEKKMCNYKTQELMDELITKKDISKVFIFARGPIYYTGRELSADRNMYPEREKVEIDEYFAAAQKSIDKIVSSGKEVFLVIENPELSFDPRACIPRPFREISKICIIEKSSVLKRFSSYIRGLNELENTNIINGLDVFCPDDRCLLFDEDGLLLYADDDHLSINGSRYQAENILRSYLR